MDPIDRAIVLVLQRNARINFRELAAEVNLSATATADRVRRLERDGVIQGYTAILDPVAAGRNLTAIIDVKLKHGTPPEGFEPVVRDLDTVVDAAHVTGTYDYQLRVAVANAGELDDVIRLLKAKANVVETATRIILRSVVSRATVPAAANPLTG